MFSAPSPKAGEIVACAQALLASGGYHGFSYADISDAVGITKASIHHHFPSKAELVRTVVRQYRESARAGLAGLEERFDDPLAQLRAYTGYWASCLRERASAFCICVMLASELPAIPTEVAQEVRGHFSDLATWLASVLERGAAGRTLRLRDEPRAEAMALMAAVHGAMLSARALGDPEVFARTVEPALQRLRPA
ncbi:MAG TPA: TetR/AcrR family transcriptional regulator [Burkholderiaceae bacterium]